MRKPLSHITATVACGLMVGAGAGYLIGTQRPFAAVALLSFAPTVALLLIGPKPVLCSVALVAMLAGVQSPGILSAGGVEVRLTDVVLLAVIAVVYLRTAPMNRGSLFWMTVAMVAWGVVRSFPEGLEPTVAFLRLVLPLVGALAISRLIPPGFDAVRIIRWFAVASVLTLPLFGSVGGGRHRGLPGGPNELGLVAACLVILALALRKGTRWREGQIGLGLAGLALSGSIAAVLATVGGFIALGWWVPKNRLGRRITSVLALAVVAPLAFMTIQYLRPDYRQTLTVHTGQARGAAVIFESGNPLVGSGWGGVQEIDADSPSLRPQQVDDLGAGPHNVYLDWLVNLGIIGLAMLLRWIALLLRATTLDVKAVVVVAAIWANSSGAFPGPLWGILGVVTILGLTRAESRPRMSMAVARNPATAASR